MIYTATTENGSKQTFEDFYHPVEDTPDFLAIVSWDGEKEFYGLNPSNPKNGIQELKRFYRTVFQCSVTICIYVFKEQTDELC